MSNKIEKIVVVGGGTAGWLSAAYLNRALGDSVEITLVESSEVPTVGVGESTFPTLVETVKFLGFDEQEFMRACNATFKMAIKYSRWAHSPKEVKDSENYFYHPFFPYYENMPNPFEAPYFPVIGSGVSRSQFWLEKHLEGDQQPFAYACYPVSELCDLKKSPRFQSKPAENHPYAYHIDAGLFADYIREVAKGRGVHHVVEHVEDVRCDANGFITGVQTRSGALVEGDLFIDSTGFKGLLINKAMGEPFLSDSDSLFVDSAVAIQADNRPDERGIRPFTTATAMDAGWMWEVPLYHRNGTGYVYSSKFISDDEAEREIRARLGEDAMGRDSLQLRMRVGRSKNFWSKNCIAVGLAGMFIEPLEATSILFTEMQLAKLLTYFPDRDFAPIRAKAYNQDLIKVYEEIRDFVIMHYALSNRRDTEFWRAVANETVIPDSLAFKMEFFRESLPIFDGDFVMFTHQSWASILAGMGYTPKKSYPLMDHLRQKVNGGDSLRGIQEELAGLRESLPDHYGLLQTLHESSSVGSSNIQM